MYINNRINFSKIDNKIKYPNLLKLQIKFFNKFFNIKTIKKKKKNFFKILKNVFPIYNKNKLFKLSLLNYYIEPPKNNINECLMNNLTYNISIKLKLKLKNYNNNKFCIQKIFLGNCPYMTNNGSFILNGAERAIVYQLQRTPGIFFSNFYNFNNIKLYYARIIPLKGSWIEIIIDINNRIYICIDRKKKIPLLLFIKAIGFNKKKDIKYILDLYDKIKLKKKNYLKIKNRINTLDIKKNKHIIIKKNILIKKKEFYKLLKYNIKYVYVKNIYKKNTIKYKIINNTINKNYIKSYNKSLLYLYKRLKNIESPNIKIAKKFIFKLFYNKKKYNLGKIGRYKINKKLNIYIKSKIKFLTKHDYKYIIKYLIDILNTKKNIDDVDHLSNKKVKTINDQLYQLFNIGLSRMSKIIKEKINVIYKKKKNIKPSDLINSKILTSIINSFFGTSQLSQFMDKTNPLSDITHKRRLTLLGPGGLIRERASFEARDVNYSYYGKLCPIETPEGPNIGLITSLCLFAKINNMGFLQTPYYKVKKGKIL
ncbi:MAG: DNA-directed RNA polymerase subunit beta, partial [Candidatus Shikimatogenerans sp. JK-2022]|nr:DNA-directed RNA polymerase subunit beta [Candidatus Shikimatogenerans bostrichidophilus]